MDSAYRGASLHNRSAACSPFARHSTSAAPILVRSTIRAVSEAEHPDRARTGRPITVEDIRQLTGAATPHFALQIRNRVAKLVAGLPAGDEVRAEGERAMARLAELGEHGEHGGAAEDEALPHLPSLGAA